MEIKEGMWVRLTHANTDDSSILRFIGKPLKISNTFGVHCQVNMPDGNALLFPQTHCEPWVPRAGEWIVNKHNGGKLQCGSVVICPERYEPCDPPEEKKDTLSSTEGIKQPEPKFKVGDKVKHIKVGCVEDDLDHVRPLHVKPPTLDELWIQDRLTAHKRLMPPLDEQGRPLLKPVKHPVSYVTLEDRRAIDHRAFLKKAIDLATNQIKFHKDTLKELRE